MSAEGPAGVLELTERGHGADERRTEDRLIPLGCMCRCVKIYILTSWEVTEGLLGMTGPDFCFKPAAAVWGTDWGQ